MHMTADALEGIESEIQKFMMQVSSRNGELQGREARTMSRTKGGWGKGDRAEDQGGGTGKKTAVVWHGGNRLDFKESSGAEGAGQEAELHPPSDCCFFFLPRTGQKWREVIQHR